MYSHPDTCRKFCTALPRIYALFVPSRPILWYLSTLQFCVMSCQSFRSRNTRTYIQISSKLLSTRQTWWLFIHVYLMRRDFSDINKLIIGYIVFLDLLAFFASRQYSYFDMPYVFKLVSSINLVNGSSDNQQSTGTSWNQYIQPVFNM